MSTGAHVTPSSTSRTRMLPLVRPLKSFGIFIFRVSAHTTMIITTLTALMTLTTTLTATTLAVGGSLSNRQRLRSTGGLRSRLDDPQGRQAGRIDGQCQMLQIYCSNSSHRQSLEDQLSIRLVLLQCKPFS
ncbi:MAG: hypothetical protein J3R72DRAFT_520027 [Linnemannia gamsii]|nr:MAG: hypothetical protein J3R72DRAFT_520027 [Linnemannia gamsii]